MNYTFDDLKSFYKGKNILITGHTGFKGGWLTSFLNYLKANTFGISIERIENYNKSGFDQDIIDHEIISDINDIENYSKQIKNFNPEIVFYLAAQPLVRDAFKNPLDTFKSNVFGLIEFLNLIKSFNHKIKTIMIVTSDKVYEQNKIKKSFIETDKLGGVEPYGASKAMQEIISKCFFESYFKEKTNIVTVRAGNVLGGGDWGSDRLIVDIMNSVISDELMHVRYPYNTRPWQYVLDLIFGYLSLVLKTSKEKEKNFNSFNFAPKKSFPAIDIINFAKNYWEDKFEFRLNKRKNQIFEEPKLSIDSKKIYKYLGWQAKGDLTYNLEKTFFWYNSFLKNMNMKKINYNMIEEFFNNK